MPHLQWYKDHRPRSLSRAIVSPLPPVVSLPRWYNDQYNKTTVMSVIKKAIIDELNFNNEYKKVPCGGNNSSNVQTT